MIGKLMLLEKIKESSLVDLLTIVTPFLLIMGLMNKIGIYTSKHVDASWFITVFTPLDFMVSDLTIYLFFATALIYLEKVIFKSNESMITELFRANIMLLSAYLAMLLLFFLTHKSLSQLIQFYFFMFLSLNGFGMIMLSKGAGKIIGFGLIILIPFVTGAQHANKIVDKKLPIVELEDGKEWYLLDKHSDQLILINTQDNKNEFKIVEMKEIKILK